MNIAGQYNSYDKTEPLKNPMSPAKQKFSFMSGDNPSIDAISKICSDGPFYINQPDRLIWLDYEPCEEQMEVVQNTDKNGIPVIDKQSVCIETPLYWEDNAIWKDGTYLNNGAGLSAKIGEVRVNGTVVEVETISGTKTPTYTSTGLVKQAKVSVSIKEREVLSEHNLSFRIFINTNNFTIDRVRSACYVS